MKRRAFVNGLLSGVCAGLASQGLGSVAWASTPFSSGAHKEITTRNSARNIVFVLLEGGPSHVDTFDLKLGRETPSLLGAQQIGNLRWPSGIMPKLAQMPQQFSIVRGINAVEAVHERAIFHLVTAHRPDASRIGEIPQFSAVMSHELAARRRPSDSLPTVVTFGPSVAQNGFLAIEHRGLNLDENGQIANLRHQFPEAEDRVELFTQMLNLKGEASHRAGEHRRIIAQAQRLMNDRELMTLLGSNPEEDLNDDMTNQPSEFRQQCEAVVRLLDADRGTHVIQMLHSGWDTHSDIYNSANPFALPALATDLDDGLAYLIATLASKPAKGGSGSMLDETLIVAAGEFGRTTGALNEERGRDHYPYVTPAFFAGGGVKGGRVIGRTTDDGSAIVDAGWSQGRFMRIGDLMATMYSAMGLDWHQRYTNTPSGRLFESVPTTSYGPSFEIDSLFV